MVSAKKKDPKIELESVNGTVGHKKAGAVNHF